MENIRELKTDNQELNLDLIKPGLQLKKAIGNPMRGSLGFPTSAFPAELLKALPRRFLPANAAPL